MPIFDGATGKVYYRHWAVAEPFAQIVFLHGYGEHSGLYHRFGEAMNARRIDLWALDATGHGRSEGNRGDPGTLAGLTANAQQLVRLAQQTHPRLPLVLLGHSMGAMTAAAVAIVDAAPFAGLILTGAPLEELTQEQKDAIADGGIMSLDPFYLDELEFDPLKFDTSQAFPRLAALLNSEAIRQIQDGLPLLRLPLWLVTGEKDLICPPRLLERWARRIPHVHARIFSATHHDIINDTTHAEVAEFIAAATLATALD